MSGFTPQTVMEVIKQGFLVGRSGPEAAEIGPQYTKRQMPR
jgi:hypothetical protein